MGRFINADSYASTGQGVLGNNTFAYCGNNPVSKKDPSGCFWEELLDEIAEIGKLASAYFAGAGLVSQADTIVPGPADILSAILLLGGTFYCAAKATYNVLTSINSSFTSFEVSKSTETDLGEIASSYGKYKCKEAVDSMVDYLKKNNQDAAIITIHYPAFPGYVYSNIKGEVISENGIHVGVLYNGIVYCNVHPFGLPEAAWIADFDGVGQKNVYSVSIS